MLHIRLDNSIIEPPSDQTFDIKNCVGGVHCNLILHSIADQSFGISKGGITWGGSVSLVVGSYFHFPMLEDTHTRVDGAKINYNCRSLRLAASMWALLSLQRKQPSGELARRSMRSYAH